MYKQRDNDDDGDHKSNMYKVWGRLEANTILQLTAEAEELIVRFTVVFVLSCKKKRIWVNCINNNRNKTYPKLQMERPLQWHCPRRSSARPGRWETWRPPLASDSSGRRWPPHGRSLHRWFHPWWAPERHLDRALSQRFVYQEVQWRRTVSL